MENKLIRYLIIALLVSFVGCGNAVLAKTLKEQRIDINVQNIPNYLLIAFLAEQHKINVVIGDEFIRSRINVNEKSVFPSELIKKIINQQGLSARIDNGIMKIASKCRLEQSVELSGVLAQKELISLNYDDVEVVSIITIFEDFVKTSISIDDSSLGGDVSIVARKKAVNELFEAIAIVQGWKVGNKFWGGYKLFRNSALTKCKALNERNIAKVMPDKRAVQREFECPEKHKKKCEALEKYNLNELLFVGYMKNSDSNRFSAVIETIDSHIYKLKVGYYMGKNYGEVRKIDKEGRIFIREIVPDNVGGWLDRKVVVELGVRYETPREQLLKKLTPAISNTALQADFIQAARYGDLAKLKSLINGNRIDIDAIYKKGGLNALTAAIYKGHYKIVKWLIRRGARVNILVTNREKSPLIIAATAGMADTVKLLLSAGAIVDLVDYKELTPLYMATSNGNMPIILLLVSKGADISKYNWLGLTPFVVAAYSGYVDIVKYFLNKGIDVNTKERNGNTMLMAATYGNKIELVKALILEGANINLSNKQKETALDIAVTKKYKELAIYLKSKGAVSFNKKH